MKQKPRAGRLFARTNYRRLSLGSQVADWALFNSPNTSLLASPAGSLFLLSQQDVVVLWRLQPLPLGDALIQTVLLLLR